MRSGGRDDFAADDHDDDDDDDDAAAADGVRVAEETAEGLAAAGHPGGADRPAGRDEEGSRSRIT